MRQKLWRPFGEFRLVRVLQRILILRAADAAIDLDILHRLHEKRNALNVPGCRAQPVNDFTGAGFAPVAWLEPDVNAAGVYRRVDGTGADE